MSQQESSNKNVVSIVLTDEQLRGLEFVLRTQSAGKLQQLKVRHSAQSSELAQMLASVLEAPLKSKIEYAQHKEAELVRSAASILRLKGVPVEQIRATLQLPDSFQF